MFFSWAASVRLFSLLFSKMISQPTVLGPLPSPPGYQNGSQNLIITARGLPFWYQIPADFSIFGIDCFRTPLFSSFSKMMSKKKGVSGSFPNRRAPKGGVAHVGMILVNPKVPIVAKS